MNMTRAIFFKEWLKTRRFFMLSVFVSLCFVVYALLKIGRVVDFKGAAHLWEVLLQKEVVFIEVLQYVPLFIGLILGIVQFVPEMVQKRLKLTLHLPYPHLRMILMMLFVGLLMLGFIFGLNYLVLGVYLRNILAIELTGRILLTSVPWYLAGIAAYFFTAWVCLEPAWKYRIIYALLAAGVLRLFFLSDVPQAYDSMLWMLAVYAFCVAGFSLLSVDRFKEGRED